MIPNDLRFFDEADCGCHADEALGHQHIRERLADLLDTLSDGKSTLADELRSDPPDDYSDEDEALNILQDNTIDGLVWTIDGGLMLLPESEFDL